MPNENANPETGAVTDMDSAVASLIAQEDPATETEETEAPQEAGETEEVEAVEADTEAEPEEDADSDEPEDAEEETEEPDPVYTVKVNGQEYEVNLEELRAGYQKGADYQNKTAELAEQRRALEAQAQQTEQLRGALEAELAKYARAEDQEPDWVKLSNELDPWEYQQRRAAWDQSRAEKALAQQQAALLQQQRHAQTITENGAKLLDAFPEWKGNQAKFEADRAEMKAAALEYGFSEQEFMGAVDHRAFVMLRDAIAGKKLRTAKPAVAKKVPKKATKVLKPGAAETKATRAAKEKTALRDNLRKRGDVDAAVDFILGG